MINRYLKICLVTLFISSCSIAVNAQTKNSQMQQLLENFYAKGEFSGVVLASQNDKIIFSGAVGKANRQWNIANQISTKFRICSITKQFTAMLVMQLVEAGKLNLDATIADYLPEFRRETASKVKIRNLLLSASALPDLPGEVYSSEDAKSADAKFVIAKYMQGDLMFEPGTKFNYSDGDFILLGEIVAQISGVSYEQNLRDKIFKPLGMKNSGLQKNENIIENIANGYAFRDGNFINEDFVQIQNFGASGAMYSSAEDLMIWDKALISNKLLSKKITDEMFTSSPKLGFVAFGSWSYKLKIGGVEKKIVERQGHINGFSALNLIIPEDNFALIFLGNVDTQTLFNTYTGKGLSAEILSVLFEK